MNDKYIFNIRPLAVALMAMGSLPVMAVPPVVPTSGAYTTDVTQSYVEDATSQGIRLPNTVLCYMNGTGANQSTVLNQPTYIALVDKNKCENASGAVNNSASGNSGASSAPDYMTGIITATRVDDASPLIGKVWFLENAMHQGQNTTTGIIYAKLTATAAPTTAEPYGHFHTDFCGLPTGGTACALGHAPFFGYAEGNGATVSAFQDGDQQVAVTMTGTVDSGSGRVQFAQQGNTAGDWAFAFDASYFLRADNGGANSMCFDRLAAHADRTAWSYGVYNADGSRLLRNSGFPIKVGSNNGYVGYWGLWLPSGVTLNDGDTVTRFSYSNNQAASATYTLVKKDGRLKKQDLHTTTLGAVSNVPIMWWADHNFTDGNSTQWAQGDTLEIRWDGSSFRITGSVTNGANGPTIVPDPTCGSVTNGNYSITACADVTSELTANAWAVSGWSQSLGGQVTVKTHDATGAPVALAGNSVVTYRTESVVTPGGTGWPSALDCVTECPAGGQTFIDGLNGTGSPYLDIPGGMTSHWNWQPVAIGNEVPYSADPASGLLKAGSSAVQWTSTSAPTNAQYTWGFQSGRMVDHSDTAALAALQCNANGTDTAPKDHYCPNRLDNVSTLYVWETGHNSWNKFTGLKDSNSTYVQFDPPLQLTYVVPASGVSADFRNASLVLQYNGFGDLQGIPGKCVNPATNAEVQCDPNGTTRWVSAFTIPADSTVSDGTTIYFVKPLQEELRLAKVTPTTTCTDAPHSLVLPTNVTLPTSSNWVDPHGTSGIGAQPTLPTTAPRVIDGVVQY